MCFPVRCFTCNKIIGGKWDNYECILNSGKSAKYAFEQIGIRRYCCKRMFLGHVNIIDKLIQYSENNIN